ncbi:MAG: hypothetical protein AAGF11_33560 [Myxococcota bacterium]
MALPVALVTLHFGFEPAWAEITCGLTALVALSASRTILPPARPIRPRWAHNLARRAIDLLLVFGIALLLVVAVAGVVRDEFLPTMMAVGLALFGLGTLLDHCRRWPRSFGGQHGTNRG